MLDRVIKRNLLINETRKIKAMHVKVTNSCCFELEMYSKGIEEEKEIRS